MGCGSEWNLGIPWAWMLTRDETKKVTGDEQGGLGSISLLVTRSVLT